MPGRLGGAGAADAAAYLPDSPAAIRNVVLVGPSGSGKTTLVESLLAATGVINRAGRVEDGTTVSDYDEAEIRQQRSVGLSLAPFVLDGVKINLLDTPGYADFVGELRAGLRAADCALFVISASDGVDGATRALWLECESVGMPRCVVISKLNHPRADYDSALAQARDVFGDNVLPLYVPEARAGADIDDLVALLSQTVSDYSDSAAGRAVRPPNEDEQLLVEEYRPALIEALIEESEDEGLMDRYMSGEEIDVRQLIDDLETAVARGSFFPVIPVCAHSGLGLEELLEVITSAFPPPPEHPYPALYTTAGKKVTGVSCDPAGDLLAEVV
jgi:elongation factor G